MPRMFTNSGEIEVIDEEFIELDEKVNRLEEEMERLSYNEKIHQKKSRARRSEISVLEKFIFKRVS